MLRVKTKADGNWSRISKVEDVWLRESEHEIHMLVGPVLNLKGGAKSEIP